MNDCTHQVKAQSQVCARIESSAKTNLFLIIYPAKFTKIYQTLQMYKLIRAFANHKRPTMCSFHEVALVLWLY